MCGVIGYHSDASRPQHRTILRLLFYESRIRGLHAFGFTARWGDGLDERLTVKSLVIKPIADGLKRLPWDGRPLTVIGHNRYSTSGDWLNMDNNQPLMIDGMALVYNGVLDMREKHEYEAAYGKTYQTGNDGEIFMRHVLDGGDPADFLRRTGSFAGCYLLDGEAYALRNSYRPLWYTVTPDATWVASTGDIMRRVVGRQCAAELPEHRAFQLRDLRRDHPVARRTQQAGYVLRNLPRYATSARYGARR